MRARDIACAALAVALLGVSNAHAVQRPDSTAERARARKQAAIRAAQAAASPTVVLQVPRVIVPSLIDGSVAHADSLLEQLGLIGRRAPNTKTGRVIRQSPPAGRPVAVRSIVTLYIDSTTAGPGDDVFAVVPNVVDLPLGPALTALRDASLRSAVVPNALVDTPNARVVAQSIPPNDRVATGTLVTVTAVIPDTMRIVPDVLRRTARDARRAMDEAMLGMLERSAPSETVDSGLVAAQDPAGGTRVPPRTRVVLTYSSGVPIGSEVPASVAPPATRSVDSTDVPDLAGLTRDEAIARLRSAQLTIGSELPPQRGLEGTVSDQRPAPGARDTVGAAVRFAIAPRSEPTVTLVPRVVPLHLDSALRVLRLARLIGAPSNDAAQREPKHWLVVGQAPAAGTSVAAGTAVGLTVEHVPDSVTVPYVERGNEDNARTLVDRGGLQLAIGERRFTLHFRETVLHQVPAAGGVVLRGSTVRVDLSRPLGWPLTLATLPLLGLAVTKTSLPDKLRDRMRKPVTSFAVHVDGSTVTPNASVAASGELVSLEMTIELVAISTDADTEAPAGTIILPRDTSDA